MLARESLLFAFMFFDERDGGRKYGWKGKKQAACRGAIFVRDNARCGRNQTAEKKPEGIFAPSCSPEPGRIYIDSHLSQQKNP